MEAITGSTTSCKNPCKLYWHLVLSQTISKPHWSYSRSVQAALVLQQACTSLSHLKFILSFVSETKFPPITSIQLSVFLFCYLKPELYVNNCLTVPILLGMTLSPFRSSFYLHGKWHFIRKNPDWCCGLSACWLMQSSCLFFKPAPGA